MRVPQLHELDGLSAAEIARIILPNVKEDLANHGGSREPIFIARSLASQTGNLTETAAVEPLLMEGLHSLIRDGLLIPSGNGQRYRLSREGDRAANGTPQNVQRSVSGVELLHPRIVQAAIPDYERGRYDEAVLHAFREVEIAVRDRSNLREYGVDLMNKAFGQIKGGERGVLTPEPIDIAEAVALRNLFVGTYSAFRNPPAHRVVGHGAAQAMRLLVTASALLAIVEELPTAL